MKDTLSVIENMYNDFFTELSLYINTENLHCCSKTLKSFKNNVIEKRNEIHNIKYKIQNSSTLTMTLLHCIKDKKTKNIINFFNEPSLYHTRALFICLKNMEEQDINRILHNIPKNNKIDWDIVFGMFCTIENYIFDSVKKNILSNLKTSTEEKHNANISNFFRRYHKIYKISELNGIEESFLYELCKKESQKSSSLFYKQYFNKIKKDYGSIFLYELLCRYDPNSSKESVENIVIDLFTFFDMNTHVKESKKS